MKIRKNAEQKTLWLIKIFIQNMNYFQCHSKINILSGRVLQY